MAVATSELLTLLLTANVGRAALATITPNLAAVSVLLAARVATLSGAEQAVDGNHNNNNYDWGGVLLSLAAAEGGGANHGRMPSW